jgi:hypothetical protein
MISSGFLSVIRPLFAFGLVLTLLAPGVCSAYSASELKKMGRIRKYKATPWEKAREMKSKYYLVRTNTSKGVLIYVGAFMDQTLRNYRRIFGYNKEMPNLEINAYRTEAEFQAAGREFKLSAETRGFFVNQNGKTSIHLPYVKHEAISPEEVLLHEGAHQFVHAAFDFQLPSAYRRFFAKEVSTLRSIPIWLDEGIATYMESGEFDGKTLEVGLINKNRLALLQQQIEKGTSVKLKDLFETPQSRFTADHYAAAWGVLYWFMKCPDPQKRQKRLKVLNRYIRASRKGFMSDPEKDFKEHFIEKKQLAADFADQWETFINKRGAKAFKILTVGRRGSFEKWEKSWQKWILSLDVPN